MYQNDVQEIADQNRGTLTAPSFAGNQLTANNVAGLLDSICDPECSALIEREFSEAHAVFMDYNMTDDAMQHMDSNCTDATTEEDCSALGEDCVYTPPVYPADIGWCSCSTGYAGAFCDGCAAGYIEYPSCRDDPCIPDPCNGHASDCSSV
eukprot:SAG31_NODE_22874_length_516_cov_0.913669_1_plen_150_part_01